MAYEQTCARNVTFSSPLLRTRGRKSVQGENELDPAAARGWQTMKRELFPVKRNAPPVEKNSRPRLRDPQNAWRTFCRIGWKPTRALWKGAGAPTVLEYRGPRCAIGV